VLELRDEETIPFLIHIFESRESIVFPSLHTLRCHGDEMPYSELITDFLKWRIAMGRPIGTLKLGHQYHWCYLEPKNGLKALRDETKLVLLLQERRCCHVS
jgi:hypothetical protein